MTCREFKHAAASLTLWELTRAQDHSVLRHTNECGRCDAWLRQQRTLAASMQTLQAETAGLEAGPSVERTLLQAFRQQHSEPAKSVAAASRFTPIALHLSRGFEFGAYVALAAAMLVGVFLGVRLLQQRPATSAVQTQSAPVGTGPARQKPDVAAHDGVASLPSPSPHEPRSASPQRRVQQIQTSSPSRLQVVSTPIATSESQPDADAGYVALMFCDPLSCSGDSQVVRMELPDSGANQNAQPQLADVVVGYDGVVRAVRIVN